MIKATALKPVTDENRNFVADVLTKRSQNIKIEYSQNAELVPPAVENLACKMLHLDAEIRGLLNNLRGFYVTKQEDFHLSLRAFRKRQRAVLLIFLRVCMALCLKFVTAQTVMSSTVN